jgi:uncharacterized protein YceK
MKIIIILFVLCLTGCGTVFSKAGNDGRYWGNPYSGVQCSVQMMRASFTNGTAILFFPLALADMIISSLTDTLVLPADLAIDPVTENIVNPCNLNSH